MSSISVQFIDEYAPGREALSILHAIQRLESRLVALEIQPIQSKAEQGEGWIQFPECDDVVWVCYPDGTIDHGEISEFVSGYTRWMPYHPGDKKPEPPKMGGE